MSQVVSLTRAVPTPNTLPVAQRLGAAVAALALGLVFLFGVGFAQPNAIHNAAHDSRHAIAFPCH